MKKSVLILILAIVFFATGCVNEDEKVTQVLPTTENTSQENEATEQNSFPSYPIGDRLDDYMTSVKEQSDTIKTYLEHDALTQADMNVKSQGLYELWDDALNYLWGELKISLPKEEFVKLQDDQRIWIAEKEKTLEEAGKEVEGGSLYSLVVNGEAAKLTEERVYELYELMKAEAG